MRYAVLLCLLALATPLPAQELEAPVVAVLKGEDGGGFYMEHRVMARWGDWWVLREYGGAGVSLYDAATGGFVRYLGARGGGPMEWAGPIDAEVVGDSLYVLDPMAARMTVIGPDLDLVRTFVVPVAPAYDFAVLPDLRLALTGVMFDRSHAGRALFFMLPETDAAVEGGVDTYDILPGEGDMRGRRSLTVAGEAVVTLDLEGVLRMFDASGKQLGEAALGRPPGWTVSFLDPDYRATRGQGDLQPSWATGIAGLGGGLVAVGVNMPRSDWRDHMEPHPEGGPDYLERHEGYQSAVVIADPASGQTHHRIAVDGYLLAVLEGGYVASARKDELGLQTITIWQIAGTPRGSK